MEMDKAEMGQEMMSDAFQMMEDPNEQADADDLYENVLSEIGLEFQGDTLV